jgi:uncharacterized protein YyaL (SSP411 family)
LGSELYREMAINAANFCIENMQQVDKQSFYHTFKSGKAKYPAFLDDYAYMIKSFIALQEVTGEFSWLEKAVKLTEYVLVNFSDETNLFFYYTEEGQQDVIVRKKEVYDGATPSGNAVMAANLRYLSIVYERKEWKERALRMVYEQSQSVVRYPTSFGIWAGLMLQEVRGIKEIAVVVADYRAKMIETGRRYIPFKVLLGAEKDKKGVPLLEKREQMGKTWIYVCEDYHCIKPVSDIEEIFNLI